MINLTDNAVAKIKEILADEPQGIKLRIFVQGGGCSGFQHGFALETEVNEDDFQYTEPHFGFIVLIDSISSQYLAGANVDYKESLMGSNFVIDVPGSKGTCGCGSSFAM